MKTEVKIHFLGAAGTVTGSKFVIATPTLNIMVDCGMFQGVKQLRQLNWEPLPFDVSDIDVVLLTHGHLDHVGYLPRLVKAGFEKQIIGTAPTLAVAKIILLDSAKIHEEDAERANKEGYSSHMPALPFYTMEEAKRCIALFSPEPKDEWITLSENISCRFRYNGHIIGATFIELDIFGKRFVFSGDVGRPDDLLLFGPKRPQKADFLFLESTYGDRHHPIEDLEAFFVELINKTIQQQGKLIIPSFAVERAQMLAYLLWKLYKKNKIPNIDIVIDSPMGSNVLDLFQRFPNWHKLPKEQYAEMRRHLKIVKDYSETWKTIDDARPKIVIAGSGMVTGGRVLTYLKQLIDEPHTTVLLVGYMAEGTRGRYLLEGVDEIKFYGKYYPVRAKIMHLQSLSAHADQLELLGWLSAIEKPPTHVFLVHGEPGATDALRVKLKDEFQWEAIIPRLYEVFTLSWES
ncbi:MBL fold metallo-hydrolase RNA specificity domain-containing protein [Sungkyunkwania multivorans]|uniref:MBL fold metallo-hydrolase RNA specificity domain-containing protein n=1 Tax=Sungkyunkwania multivorans TaxID=1173618 RepID=A0ABW3D4A2_9FLAO